MIFPLYILQIHLITTAYAEDERLVVLDLFLRHDVTVGVRVICAEQDRAVGLREVTLACL